MSILSPFFKFLNRIVDEIMITNRDFHRSYTGTHLARTVDLMTSELYPVKGQDFVFHNLGASSITVIVDRITTKTVRPHDVFNWLEKSDFYIVEIINASGVLYELVVWGERVIR